MIRRLAYLPVVLLTCVNVGLYAHGIGVYAMAAVGFLVGMLAEWIACEMEHVDAARRRKAVRP